jgi:hypothetical protein
MLLHGNGSPRKRFCAIRIGIKSMHSPLRFEDQDLDCLPPRLTSLGASTVLAYGWQLPIARQIMGLGGGGSSSSGGGGGSDNTRRRVKERDEIQLEGFLLLNLVKVMDIFTYNITRYASGNPYVYRKASSWELIRQ